MNQSISTNVREFCYVLLRDHSEYKFPVAAFNELRETLENKKFVTLDGDVIRTSQVIKITKRTSDQVEDKWKMTPAERQHVNTMTDALKRSLSKPASECHIARWLYRFRNGLSPTDSIPFHIGRVEKDSYVCEYGVSHEETCKCAKDFRNMSAVKFHKVLSGILGYKIQYNEDIQEHMRVAVSKWIRDTGYDMRHTDNCRKKMLQSYEAEKKKIIFNN